MAYIELYKKKLIHNYQYLNKLFGEHNKEWAIVTKLLCGTKVFLKEVSDLGIMEICDSRVSNLKTIKEINPNIQTVYIKPPAKRSIAKIIQFADVSFNTEFETIKALSQEAVKQNRTHKIIIMIELGDLREGVMGDRLLDFYKSIFKLPNIKISGIGANLNCLSGILPTQDKMIQLSLYKQLIDATFQCNIPWVTGGTSITIPLLKRKQIPKGINHFRVGETLFFGNNILENKPVKEMKQDVFKLFAEIIEITKKPKVPIGYLAENPSGDVLKLQEGDYNKTSYRAILDVGLLDTITEFLIAEDPDISIIGASSDMLIVDIEKSKQTYKVGDLISFRLKYMGALHLFNSNYIEKRVVPK